MVQSNDNINVHPAAKVHPSVIMEGIVTVGAYTEVGAGTVLTGHVTIGHHCLLACNVVVRGGWIGNHVHIYDCVCIEQGRPGSMGTSTAAAPDKLVIGDYCWVNHGATMHGTQMGEGSAVGLNSCCDYNTRIGKGGVLANGSTTHVDQIIPENCVAQGVPARIVEENITDEDRIRWFGVLPIGWIRFDAEWREQERQKAERAQ